MSCCMEDRKWAGGKMNNNSNDDNKKTEINRNKWHEQKNMGKGFVIVMICSFIEYSVIVFQSFSFVLSLAFYFFLFGFCRIPRKVIRACCKWIWIAWVSLQTEPSNWRTNPLKRKTKQKSWRQRWNKTKQ